MLRLLRGSTHYGIIAHVAKAAHARPRLKRNKLTSRRQLLTLSTNQPESWLAVMPTPTSETQQQKLTYDKTGNLGSKEAGVPVRGFHAGALTLRIWFGGLLIIKHIIFTVQITIAEAASHIKNAYISSSQHVHPDSSLASTFNSETCKFHTLNPRSRKSEACCLGLRVLVLLLLLRAWG